MNIHDLYQSVTSVVKSSPSLAASLQKYGDICAAELTKRMHEQSTIVEFLNDDNDVFMELRHQDHFAFLVTIYSLFDPISFVEQFRWEVKTFASRGFSLVYWEIVLPECVSILSEFLSASEVEEISLLYSWMYEHVKVIASINENTPTFFESLGMLHKEEHE